MGWVDTREGVIEGFVLAQQRANTAHLGPWIHRSPWGAEKLLRTALGMLLGNEVRLEIPDPNGHASTFAWNHGLRHQRHCTRMIYGDAPAPQENLQDLYGVASFATG